LEVVLFPFLVMFTPRERQGLLEMRCAMPTPDAQRILPGLDAKCDGKTP
jgi:hypothetical protein